MPHANPASPAADGKLDPASLADKIDALAEKATEIQLWGNCACDGFSVGHEPGCTRKVVGTATRLKERDARKMAALVMDNLPTLTRALRDAERMREALERIEGTTMSMYFKPADMVQDIKRMIAAALARVRGEG